MKLLADKLANMSRVLCTHHPGVVYKNCINENMDCYTVVRTIV